MLQRVTALLLDLVPRPILYVLAALSVLTFVGTLLLIPLLLIRIPPDYFDPRVPRTWFRGRHPALRVAGHLVKNTVGGVFLAMGVVMLFTPGQGILTMLVGLSLLDFPGKRGLEAKFIGLPGVLKAINHLRQQARRPPLVLPDP
jgi:hypothetical protein